MDFAIDIPEPELAAHVIMRRLITAKEDKKVARQKNVRLLREDDGDDEKKVVQVHRWISGAFPGDLPVPELL